ncbi:LysR family transcriptional regulator [Paracoccus sp. WLY502]|uniref:helix-turn-helix domain-containing protein n=1 Tax=Paracoccus yibinensis TaxID=3068891 RepID=UPI002796C9A6|nr:LysR family transcriptional regulator [Paracoccus sp. WLY502]MDQ1901804.1 LysR family transcriptional regulator [Paracoccus sp. WLY502]
MRYLRAVADSDSLTGAAGLLRLTTPAIRSQLRGLEDLAGCPLVQKAGHGAFRPTPAGMALLLAESQVATALAVPDATSAPCSRAVWETWFWTSFPPASISRPA